MFTLSFPLIMPDSIVFSALSCSDLLWWYMQAVPSGSGRLNVGNLQEVQPIGSHTSGKALITAALTKMGLTPSHSAKAS